MDIDNITDINNNIININVHAFIKSYFFMLLIAKSFEIFTKHNRYLFQIFWIFISEHFDLNRYFFVLLTNNKLLLPL